ncbi:MAG: hypothetical protein H0U57_10205 [Tatlockia sp.]|nr:hypothetical protein [Tatlockia sp.]
MLRINFTLCIIGDATETATKMLQANSAIIDSPETNDPNQSLFTPSTSKLVIMSICTLGLYNIYWFYKNWCVFKKAGKKCNPFLRSLFAPLFAYSCFYEIRDLQLKNGIRVEIPIFFLAITYFILDIMVKLPDPYWLLSLLSFLPIAAANQVALQVNQAQFPGFISNHKFSKLNWLGIIIGGTMFLLCIFGTLF